MSPKRQNLVAFLGGLSLFLSTLEYLFPKPVPFFRLGLANLPILLSLGILHPREIVVLGFLKVLGQGLVNGTLASYVFLFSLGGTAASVVAMYGYYRLFPHWTSYLGISLIGALASNLVQVWLSLGFIFGASAWVIVPYFLGMGGATGIVMGFFAQIFVKNSRWFSFLTDEFPVLQPGLPGKSIPRSPSTFDNLPVTQAIHEETSSTRKPKSKRQLRKQWIMGHGNPTYLFILGLGALVLFALQSRLEYRVLQVILLYLVAEATGKHIRLGYFLILFLSVTIFHLLQPTGQVLFQLGPFPITQGALAQGAFRALTLIGFVFGSLAFVQPHLQLPGWTGQMIGDIFRYYEGLNHFRGHLKGKGFIQTLDRLLFSVFSPSEPVELTQESQKWEGKNHPGVLLIGIGVVLLFLFLLWKVG
ncbi:MAG: hypothetical protein GW949_09840 [Spirochaetales bacterium]|nr:hypothetical protein [Spirochaetales bacterium]